MNPLRTMALLAGLFVGTAGCGGRSSTDPVPTLVGRGPADIAVLTVTGDQRPPAVFTRTEGAFWRPGVGLGPETAAMLFDGQSTLFPLRAYRRLDVDPSDPAFGLVPPKLVASVRDHTGRTTELSFGAATFNQEGYYAQRSGDRHTVYLVPRAPVNLLRSLAEGRTVEFDYPVEKKFDDLATRAARPPDEENDPWMTQALKHGATSPDHR